MDCFAQHAFCATRQNVVYLFVHLSLSTSLCPGGTLKSLRTTRNRGKLWYHFSSEEPQHRLAARNVPVFGSKGFVEVNWMLEQTSSNTEALSCTVSASDCKKGPIPNMKRLHLNCWMLSKGDLYCVHNFDHSFHTGLSNLHFLRMNVMKVRGDCLLCYGRPGEIW